ncbi:MAG: hypothetical protein KDD44_08640, partial [Bdellovibrionales bacterium]|nr:hypothetical protein [Bdellovibrionales bacterium]
TRFGQLLDDLARHSRSRILDLVSAGFSTRLKEDRTPVTDVDIEVEQVLRSMIADAFPDHGVIGEEFPQSNPDAEFQWILDPIDGTEELASGLPLFGTIIALHYNGKPVAGLIDHPLLGETFRAVTGQGTTLNGAAVAPLDLSPSEEPLVRRLAVTTRKNFFRHDGDPAVFDRIVEAFPNIRVYHSCFAHTATIRGGFDAMFECNVKL